MPFSRRPSPRSSQKLRNRPRSNTKLRTSLRQKSVLKTSTKLKTAKSLKKIQTQVETRYAAEQLQLQINQQYQGGKKGSTGKQGGMIGGKKNTQGGKQTKKDTKEHKKSSILPTEHQEIQTIFQSLSLDITSIDFNDLADDYDEIRKLFGGKIPRGSIARFYKQKLITVKTLSRKKSTQGLNISNPQTTILTSKNCIPNEIDFDGIRSEATNDRLLQELRTKKNPIKLITAGFPILQYLFKVFTTLSLAQKKQLLTIITNILESYKEGKIIEIYEIQISDNGTIIIKTNQGAQTVDISPIGKNNLKKVKKFLEK